MAFLSSYLRMLAAGDRDERRQLAWRITRAGGVVLPLFPGLAALGLTVVLLLRARETYQYLSERRLLWGWVGLAGWLVLTAALAVHKTEAFLGLANFLPFMAIAVVLRGLIQQPEQLRQLAWAFIIPSPFVVLLGLGQLFAGWGTPYLFLGWELIPGGEPAGRLSSVFIYANFLAFYLLICFILALGLWFETHRTWRAGYRARGRRLLLLSLMLVAIAAGLLLSSSRNAWGLAGLASVAFAVYGGWHWLVGVMGLGATSVFWAAFGPLPLREGLRRLIPAYIWGRLSDSLYPDRPLPSLRATQWQFAWQLGEQRPWTGWGLRNFTPLYEEATGWWFGHPHNLGLMLIAEIGIPGTLLFCSLVAGALFPAVRLLGRWRKNPRNLDDLILFSYLVAFASCVLFNLLDVTLFDFRGNLLGWMLLGALWGIGENWRSPLREA